MIESLASRVPIFSSITGARIQETIQLQVGDWIDDSLLLFDLGYPDYARLARIDRSGGWFVSRSLSDRTLTDLANAVDDEFEAHRHSDGFNEISLVIDNSDRERSTLIVHI